MISIIKSRDDTVNAKKIKEAFDSIKEEFNEHLDAINKNTSEIKENFDYCSELDAKIEKLSEKIDEIAFFLKELDTRKDHIVSLSPHEQKVFLVLYLGHSPLPFFEIVKRAQLPAALVEKILNSMCDKSIPLIVQKIEDQEFYLLDSKFKERQARENIVKIDENTTKSMFVRDLNSFM